jgi:cobalamin-dependent methionine synthase I
VLDASRAVPVTSSPAQRRRPDAFVAAHREEMASLRRIHGAPRVELATLTAAREAAAPITWRGEDVSAPGEPWARGGGALGGRAARLHRLDALLPHLGAQGGVPPDPLPRGLRRAGAAALRRRQRPARPAHRARALRPRGVYGLFAANAVGDDVELYRDESRGEVLARVHFLRQQSTKDAAKGTRCLADFIAPKVTGLRDHLGAFAVTRARGSTRWSRASRPSTTTTTPSWPRPSPTASPRPSPSAAQDRPGALGLRRATKTSPSTTSSRSATAGSARRRATPRAPTTPRRPRSGRSSTSSARRAFGSPRATRCGPARA